MEIVSVSPSRRNNRLLWLKLSDGSLYPFSADDYVLLGLKKTENLTDDQVLNIQTHSARFMLLEYSYRQIGISPKVRYLLLQKLRQYHLRLNQKYHYPDGLVIGLIEEVLDKIDSQGLLDENQFVNYYVRRHSKQSSAQIKFHLRQLGLDPAIKESDEKDKITMILNKKYPHVNFSDFKSRQKVVASLYRKGFALSDIKTAIDDYPGELVKYSWL